ncbi:15026_t:CDS:2, partial [Acaulospora colombiana]
AFAKAHVKAVILVGRSEYRLTSTKERFDKMYPEVEFVVIAIDVGIPESVQDMFNKLKVKFSHIDVLIHNAGVLNDYGNRVGETDVDKFWYDTVATVITSSTLINEELTGMTAYLVSKLSAAKLVQILNAGVVETEMLLDSFRPIAFDKPTLSAALSVLSGCERFNPATDYCEGK